jgi:hypothetical protein
MIWELYYIAGRIWNIKYNCFDLWSQTCSLELITRCPCCLSSVGFVCAAEIYAYLMYNWLLIVHSTWICADCGVGGSNSQDCYYWDSCHSLHTLSYVRWPENIGLFHEWGMEMVSLSWQTFQYFVAMFRGVEGAERLTPHTIAVIETNF